MLQPRVAGKEARLSLLLLLCAKAELGTRNLFRVLSMTALLVHRQNGRGNNLTKCRGARKSLGKGVNWEPGEEGGKAG